MNMLRNLKNFQKIISECEPYFKQYYEKNHQFVINKLSPMCTELDAKIDTLPFKMEELVRERKWEKVHKYSGNIVELTNLRKNFHDQVINTCVKNGNSTDVCQKNLNGLIKEIENNFGS